MEVALPFESQGDIVKTQKILTNISSFLLYAQTQSRANLLGDKMKNKILRGNWIHLTVYADWPSIFNSAVRLLITDAKYN